MRHFKAFFGVDCDKAEPKYDFNEMRAESNGSPTLGLLRHIVLIIEFERSFTDTVGLKFRHTSSIAPYSREPHFPVFAAISKSDL